MLETMVGRASHAMKGVQDFCWSMDSTFEKLSEIKKKRKCEKMLRPINAKCIGIVCTLITPIVSTDCTLSMCQVLF